MAVESEKYSEQCQTSIRKEQTTEFDRQRLEDELLSHLTKSNAIFKSEQKGEPELTSDEKMIIGRDLLEKNHCVFLSKFGHFLKPEHLKYFDDSQKVNYEVAYHISRLHRYFNNATRERDIKNRRYEALKILIGKGEYFSETEMMNRNPLLYEQLVGKYMTEKQKMERDNVTSNSISYVNFLMETIEKDDLRKRQKLQEEEEGATKRDGIEETDSDAGKDNDGDNDNHSCSSQESKSLVVDGDSMEKFVRWGPIDREDVIVSRTKAPVIISKEEKQLLRNEFVSNMYQSFLEGKDVDFDYSTVDNNEAYDNIELRTQDEEEKYFDSESPEILCPAEEDSDLEYSKTGHSGETVDQSDSDDELDIYMKSLKEQIPPNIVPLDNET